MYHQTSRKETRLLFFVFDNQYKTKSNNILVTYFGASLKIEILWRYMDADFFNGRWSADDIESLW